MRNEPEPSVPDPPVEAWYRQPDLLVDSMRGDGDDRVPFAIEAYEDLVEIRRGAQGVVFAGQNRETNERVAIKVLHADVSERSRLRFLREIELVSQLRHPNIVAALDHGRTDDGRPFFVMPFVSGVPLMEYVTEQLGPATTRPSLDTRLELFLAICEAVGHAHQRGVIHRDLKPSNIRVDGDGGPHVLDFGLARTETLPGTSERGLTLDTHFLGTLAYAAPEQASGHADAIDTRTDVYALGIILYEMLDGGLPYDTTGPFSSALAAIATEAPRRLATGRRVVDRDLEAIVFTAIQKDPAARYQSVDALAADVRRYRRGDAIDARPESIWTHLRTLVRRHRLASALIAAIAMLLVCLALVSTIALSVIDTKREAAVLASAQAKAEAQKVQQLAGFYESIFKSVRPDQAGQDVLVRDILDDAAARLDEEITDAPEVAGLLHVTLGETYQLLGRPQDAIRHLERAVTLKTDAGVDALDLIATQAELTVVYAQLGRVPEAAKLATTTLAALRAQPEAPPLLEAQLLEAQGSAALAESGYEAAEPMFAEALRLKRSADTPPMALAEALNNLGMIREHIDEFDAAAELYREGMELMDNDEPGSVYARAALTHNLANLQYKLRRFEDAVRLFRASLAMTRELYGPRHLDEAATLETLGGTLTQLDAFEEAGTCLETSLDIRRERLPAGHLKIASTLSTLGELRLAEERNVEALTLLREARAMRAAQLGDTHWLTAKADARIGLALVREGRFDEAHPVTIAAYEHMLADGGIRRAAGLGAVDTVCALYKAWPTPDAGAGALIDAIVRELATFDAADDLVERVRYCQDRLAPSRP